MTNPFGREKGKTKDYALIAITCVTAATKQISTQKILKAPQGLELPALA
jgi:hypothetical protein